jgi:hypothetical protein
MDSELDARIADQQGRGFAVTYDRNGLRLGIAALQDELKELYDEWAAGKKRLDDPGVRARLAHEALDAAAVAMQVYVAAVDGPDPTELECPSHPGKFGDH